MRVGLADYHKTVAIYDPKTGRKWAQDDSVESNHVPLDIRSVSHDTMETATEVHLPVTCPPNAARVTPPRSIPPRLIPLRSMPPFARADV